MERTTPPPGYVCHRCNVSGMTDLENLYIFLIWLSNVSSVYGYYREMNVLNIIFCLRTFYSTLLHKR